MESENILISFPNILKYNHHLYTTPPTFPGHSHNVYELIYVISGDATHVIEGKKYKLKSGDLVIAHPSKYHFIQMDSKAHYERQNILFDHKQLGIDVSMIPPSIDVVSTQNDGIVHQIFEKLDYYAKNLTREDFLKVAKLLIQEVLYNVSFIEDKSNEHPSVINPILAKALEYIAQNLFTVKDVSEVAQAVFVTDSYLFRLFKNELRKSPKKYITEKKLLYAQAMLKKGKKPVEAASECGFEDYTTFYRNYVLLFGKSPSDESSEGNFRKIHFSD